LSPTFWAGSISFVFIIVAWGSCYASLPEATENTAALRGTEGDWFGSLNALFSGLAFCGVIITILLQREELKSNTKQLEQQSIQLRRQANVMRNSAVLSSLPAMLNDSVAKLTYLSYGLGSGVAVRTVADLESELEDKEEDLQPFFRKMLDLAIVQPQTDAEKAKIQEIKNQIKPDQDIIRELEWYIGLRKDLFSHYAPLAGIDPEAPWDDRWGE
jgi:hypothetical protein